MPNWCDNTLSVRGRADKLNEFIQAFRGFPVDWDNDSSGLLDKDPVAQYVSMLVEKKKKEREKKETFNALVPIPKEIINKGYSNAYTEIGAIGFDQYLNSEVDGYTWCVKNWGTKWDIYDESSLSGEDLVNDALANNEFVNDIEIVYSFNTAWSPCVPFVIKIGPKFPDLKFELTYCELGCQFAGKLVVHGTSVESDEYDSTSDEEAYNNFIHNELGYEIEEDNEE